MNVTFKRICNGNLEALLNGEKTGYGIVNGSLGMSGRGFNHYGITRPDGTTRWIGTLQACKKAITFTLTRPQEVR